MDENILEKLGTLETLEYTAVLKELASFTATPPGAALAASLRPLDDVRLVRGSFAAFTEARDIIRSGADLPLGGVMDLRPVLSRIDPEGSYLLTDDLLQVKSTISVNIALKSVLNPAFERAYPIVSSRILSLSDQRPLFQELNRVIDEKGQIKDTASPELFRIRREIRQGRERARTFLEGLVKDRKFKEFLQDDFITIRDDRYVLSIKAGMQGSLSGVIHGRSGSGATYFIEPFQTVELNNRVSILKKEETAEEIEILKALTAVIAENRDLLLSDLEAIGGIDLIRAKALFGLALKCAVPEVKDKGEVRFISARHPLLAVKEARDKDAPKTVPVDIVIAEGCKVLVISGANTGGKTVALKTMGLLTLMALSGIPVPADEGSSAVRFTSVFSDIGDRQDIIASLSTFSAHVKRIREFLDLAGPGSLVLIDEIGAGTDPSEGCALALAALETFREKGVTTVVTTHLNLLKARAQTDPEYMNASVEFDEKTLSPLYRLHYGVPGPSLGLSIAESLGIPSGLIARARANLRDSESAFIDSVRLLEEEREEVRRLRERLSGLEAMRDKAVRKLRDERDAMMEKAKKKVDQLVMKAREEIRETVERLREEGAARSAVSRASRKVEEISKALPGRSGKRELYIPKPGDRAAVEGTDTRGIVVRVDGEGKKAELRVGPLKVWVAWDKLVKKDSAAGRKASQDFSLSADMEVAMSINIIGMRAEEAIARLTRFLDNAHASGLSTVEIIHGVGTGRLSKAVEEHLGSIRFVKRFYHGDPARGGAGVTIAELT